jgi:hypothetical protein
MHTPVFLVRLFQELEEAVLKKMLSGVEQSVGFCHNELAI